MNDFLIKLMKLRSKILKDGWLVLPPTPRDDQLALRVDWYLDKKYSFHYKFSERELNDTNIDLAEYFIKMANDEIKLLTKNQEQQK